jgi:DNA-binding NarL/FixJ family response regulator
MPAKLTPREQEICRLIAEGKTNRGIAELLGIALSTVRNTNYSLFNKIGASNRAELVRMVSAEPE